MVKYENDIEEIRKEVRTIRIMTDEMKTQLTGMKSSLVAVDSSVQKQTEDIQHQREYHEKLKGIVGSIKDAVVKLESENIPAKKQELSDIRNENSDDTTPSSGFIVKTEQDGMVTKVYTEKLPSIAPLTPVKKDFKVSEESKSGFGYAVKDGVILWQSPTKNSDVLEILVSWQQLSLLGKIDNDSIRWWKVKTKDYTGYVNSKFVIISD
ncbi:MAG: hypothetical protein C0603_01090 [Denitrovibrio sp.]|nr:MAG: hypothetical protein C0603_01090 [Denitrovibrio sp.]